jgi:hypothetical protein
MQEQLIGGVSDGFVGSLTFDFLTNYHDYEEPKNNYNLYPNPSRSRIFLEITPKSASQINDLTYNIINVLGQKILKGGISPVRSKTEIDVSSLPAGSYYLMIGQQIYKFVKL